MVVEQFQTCGTDKQVEISFELYKEWIGTTSYDWDVYLTGKIYNIRPLIFKS